MKVLETDRLRLVELSADDAPFMLALLNEPSFLRFIGDRGVRTVEEAEKYILDGPVASYRDNGFGMYLVRIKSDETPVGLCGLVRRPELDDIDIGFAFKPEYWSQGFATESAAAVFDYATSVLGIDRIVAITAIDNHASARVLEKIGLRFERLLQLAPDDAVLKLYANS